MIEIGVSQIRCDSNFAIISSSIQFDGKVEELWYKIPVKFKAFLVSENLDAFLIGILFLGLKSGEDIILKGMVSARLHYTLTHYLIPALCIGDPSLKPFKIISSGLNRNNINAKKVAGTGLSCGVDSFATYYDHIKEDPPFNIEYFTFFNVGSHGDLGGERSRKIYNERLSSVKNFAKGEGKEVITVDSNLSEILKMNFQKTHSFRNISCVLLFQKLFSNYYYASAYRFDHFHFNSKDTSDADLFYLSMLNTESTNFYSSVAQYSRIERTLLVSNYPETFKFLDVCTNPWEDKSTLNCSICYKCLRTQLTLELGNKLKFYNHVFDIAKYEKRKYKYVGKLLTKKRKSALDIELINFMKEKNFNFSSKIYFYSLLYVFKSIKNSLKQIIKEKIGYKY